MPGWSANIEEATIANTNFRTVLFTGPTMQLTVMSLAPGEEIGLEVHGDRDQFLRIEKGRARVVMGPAKERLDETKELPADWAIIIPSGTWHNVVNVGDEELKLYSLYAPPEHPDGAVHETKADAAEAERHS
jgi:mannose-6-phosphate isomerase-like protein (cupin superfamily)